MTLRQLDAPVRIDSADFGIFHVFDNSRISAPLALLFSSAAVTRAVSTQCPPTVGAVTVTALRDAFGIRTMATVPPSETVQRGELVGLKGKASENFLYEDNQQN